MRGEVKDGMTDIPIIFSAPMVRALLDGRMTITRRPAWLPYDSKDNPRLMTRVIDGRRYRASPWQRVRPGDRLWVREYIGIVGQNEIAGGDGNVDIIWHVEGEHDGGWRRGHWPSGARRKQCTVPPIRMPRWASRLTLTVTAVTIEPGAWKANPHVVAIAFTVARQNLDARIAA